MRILTALLDHRTYNFEHAFGVKDLTSPEMSRAIQEWYHLYYQREVTQREDPSQRLPVAVVSKLTRTAFSEYSAKVEAETSKREYLSAVLRALDRCRKRAMQQALIGGEAFLKPILPKAGVQFRVVNRNHFLVLGRNDLGEITDLGTTEDTQAQGWYYTMLERRTVDQRGYLTIESRLYRSTERGVLGTEVPLGTLAQYAGLERINSLPAPVWSLGLVPLRTPMENCVDGSSDGVSVFAPAAGLIRRINVNEAQLNGEFERGESRILVSSDLMQRDAEGRHRLTEHVFSGLDEAPEDIGITIFSPALREQSFLARKTEYLRNVESLIGLKRGILSEVEAAERTATEVTSSAGDYNLTILDFQQMWERAVREAVRVCDLLGEMYGLCSGPTVDPETDISVDWGNGILYDEDKTWADYKDMVASGLLKPEIALAWKFNLPWETPEDLANIRETYMPQLEHLTGGE